MKLRDVQLHLTKAVDEAGTFEGYGSVFNNTDAGGDIVMPGAFAKSLAKHKQQGTYPLMLWQHDPDQPIGVWEDLHEDGKGLFAVGKLLKGVQVADEAYIRLKAGAVRGMSIGYEVVDSEQDGNARRLKELDLWEVSIVSFAMNRRARVDAVKGETALSLFAQRLRDGAPPDIKEFEDLLREAGIPKRMACDIASVGYAKAIRRESEGEAKLDLTGLRVAIAEFGKSAG